MVTFVAGFVSPEIAKAWAPVWPEYKRRTQGVRDAAERERIFKELAATVKAPPAAIAQVADHVEHVRKVAGVDHVGLGGDYDGNTQWPVGLEDTSRYPYLFAELIRRGWSEHDLQKLASANLLRVLRGAEATARRLQKARPPSLATIEALDTPTAP
jgi:membrane dipeptidase